LKGHARLEDDERVVGGIALGHLSGVLVDVVHRDVFAGAADP
jgi:hypothetical protein